MLLVVLSGFVLAVLAPGLYRLTGEKACWLAALLPAAITAYLLGQIDRLDEGQVLLESHAWAANLDLQMDFALDGLSLLFGLLIAGMGTVVLVYSHGYFAGYKTLGRFLLLILVFMAAMLGMVFSDNLLLLFVFWELTTYSSYFLIGFNHEDPRARDAARQALLVTAGGGLALLAGLILLGVTAGTFQISQLVVAEGAIREHALYLPILILIGLGALTKSAQFPFHFWLPDAMQAPTPVSAYLHSATMVKAGIYLLARFHPVLGGTFYWSVIFATLGAITMVMAAWLAFHRTDLKQILAYSTVSVLGMLTMLLGLGTELAVTAAVLTLLAHAMYKGALFLVVGAIDHETGERDIALLGGLRKVMPWTAMAAGLAALSMAGLLPAFGFVAKEIMYEAAQGVETYTWLVLAAAMVASMLLVAVAGVVFLEPFAGELTPACQSAHEAPTEMWLGPILLGVLGLTFGFMPQLLESSLIAPSVAAITGQAAEIHLALWHGFNLTLLLSLITFAVGATLFFFRWHVWRTRRIHEVFAPLGPARGYQLALRALDLVALWQTRFLQNGYLRFYLATIVVFTVGLIWFALLRSPIELSVPDWRDIRFYEAVVGALILGATFVVVHSHRRLSAILGLGVVGYGMATIYVIFGAPDLAMTQFVIETLSVVLLVLVFYRLPPERPHSGRVSRVRDAVLALFAGGTLTSLLLFARGVRTQGVISDYFAEQSLPAAHGRNIVNVILVDFRGLDTLGEITVLAVAGIGAYALMKVRLGKKGKPS